MSAARRFFASTRLQTPLIFQIDTRNVASGATDGSQLDNQFILPLDFPTSGTHNFIIKVSDGRPDVGYNGTNPNARIITFATPGIYTITLIGRSNYFKPWGKADVLKWVSLDSWSSNFKASSYDNYFNGALNLIIRSKTTIKLTGNCSSAFANIKGFDPSFELSKVDVSETNSVAAMFLNITTSFYYALNAFMNQVTTIGQLYRNVNMSNVTKVEIIAPQCNNANYILGGSGFRGTLIITAPLTSIFGLVADYTNPPALGQVDIRLVNTAGSFINSVMSRTNVDSTLLGWVNNFDWSGIANATNKVTFDFYNSTYSNNASVIAAKAFLETKGIVFTRLTMA